MRTTFTTEELELFIYRRKKSVLKLTTIAINFREVFFYTSWSQAVIV